MEYNQNLTTEEKRIIFDKGTEAPFSGEFCDNKKSGKYYCKNCGELLFDAKDKFDSGSGWPSFDDEVNNSVKKEIDEDGVRTEILCNNCGAHLGHIFHGENFTKKNQRYCVNSLSLNFKAEQEENSVNEEIAYFAAGCFWGVEYHFSKAKGVKSAISGYMGGDLKKPTYEDVCYKETKHFETVKVVFDKDKTNFEELCKLFFEIHDPEQKNGQGPDIGSQYLSAIFYVDEKQKEIANKLIDILQNNGLQIATKLIKAQEEGVQKFWSAEDYHQNYYHKNNKSPYCHNYIKRF